MSSRRVVGIDGGATRTRYLLADGEGKILERAEGRGSLLGAGEDDEVTRNLATEVRELVRKEGGALPLDALCAGLAGAAGRPEARRSLERLLSELGIAERVSIVPDAEVAFVDAFGDAAGILLVAGTGSIGIARGSSGDLERVGGWGALLGDEGSGYRIGLDGLTAAIRGSEGRGDSTGLTETLFGAMELASVAALLEWSRGASKSEIAALARHVTEQADRGDAVAEEIVSRAVEALVRHAQALERRVSVSGGTVALVGGLVEPGGPLRQRLTVALDRVGLKVLDRRVEPPLGAVRLALGL